MAQVLLHLPLRANVIEQLDDRGACAEGGGGRRGKVSSPWLGAMGRGS